jgi:hypothetical protein
VARAKRTARAEARRRYRAEHPLEADEVDDLEDEPEADAAAGAEADEAPPARRRSSPARPPASRAGGAPARPGASRPSALRAFRDAYQPADIRADLRALPELLRSRAVTIPALLVVISAVVLVLAVQMAPAGTGLPGASASLAASASAGASAGSPAPSSVASASPTPSSVAAGGAATVSGSPLGVIASIMALLFLGIPSPPAIGGIYLAAILAKRSSWLAGGIAGFLGSMGALAAVIAISPNQAGESIAVFAQILATSVVFGLVIGAGLGYYRRLLRLMNPTPNRPTAKSKQPARRR